MIMVQYGQASIHSHCSMNLLVIALANEHVLQMQPMTYSNGTSYA